MTRGFWDGLLAGGVVGAALAAMYMTTSDHASSNDRMTEKVGKTKQIMAEMGQEVASVWKK